MTLEDLTPDPRNANKGTLRGTQLLDSSLETFGAARSIVVDKHGVCLAGNKTLEAAVAHGLAATVVDTAGDTLVVVQRTDLDLADPHTRQLAYLDNRCADVGLDWDPQILAEDVAQGIDLSALWSDTERPQPSLVTARLTFDREEQRRQFQRLLGHLKLTGQTLGAWVAQQLKAADE